MSTDSKNRSYDYDLVVIGSGPGGFDAAVEAARAGLRVSVIEKAAPGGVCVNWGCIPTKALLRSAGMFHMVHESEPFGLAVTGQTIDAAQAVKRSRRVALTVSKGVEYSLKKEQVDLKRATASFLDAHTLAVSTHESTETVTAEHIIVATGGTARELPGLEFDGRTVISSREALAIKEVPGRMLIIGGGAIGVEMAWYFSASGTEVTLVELMPHILPLEDAEIGEGLKRSLVKGGIDVHTEAAVRNVEQHGDGILASLELHDGSKQTLEADCVLVAVGVRPFSDGLALENAGVETEKGFIKTDGSCRTTAENIYAIGDVTGGMMLAHKASAEARIAVHAMTGRSFEPLDETRIPRCVYVEPSVASVGYTEQQAGENGLAVKAGRASFATSGKASAYGNREGFVKLVFDEASGELLGGHVLGHDAVELIGELSLARHLGATDRQIAETIHAHPTLSESIQEAARDALGE